MTPEKLTDEQILQALECCRQPVGRGACNDCPFDYQREKKLEKTDKSCTELMFDCILDLINRLKAENKDNTEKFNCQQKVYSDLSKIIKEQAEELKTAKIEAYKEFAELLKDNAEPIYDDEVVLSDKHFVEVEDIDYILKEKLGD